MTHTCCASLNPDRCLPWPALIEHWHMFLQRNSSDHSLTPSSSGPCVLLMATLWSISSFSILLHCHCFSLQASMCVSFSSLTAIQSCHKFFTCGLIQPLTLSFVPAYNTRDWYSRPFLTLHDVCVPKRSRAVQQNRHPKLHPLWPQVPSKAGFSLFTHPYSYLYANKTTQAWVNND